MIGFVGLGDDSVRHLWVLPRSRTEASGTALLELAKGRRPEGLQLWVFQRNVGARRFYERHGFTLVELTDGSRNEEREPDALYVWSPTLQVRIPQDETRKRRSDRLAPGLSFGSGLEPLTMPSRKPTRSRVLSGPIRAESGLRPPFSSRGCCSRTSSSSPPGPQLPGLVHRARSEIGARLRIRGCRRRSRPLSGVISDAPWEYAEGARTRGRPDDRNDRHGVRASSTGTAAGSGALDIARPQSCRHLRDPGRGPAATGIVLAAAAWLIVVAPIQYVMQPRLRRAGAIRAGIATCPGRPTRARRA